jgi:imidazolonepropionase-like amidohydrolase
MKNLSRRLLFDPRLFILFNSIISILLFATIAYSQTPATSATLALTNATVIDGNGGKPLAKTTVVISGDRIADIFPAGKKKIPAGATIIDLSGQYIIPGLFDSHVHVATGPQPKEAQEKLLRFALLGGITSVRDMGGDAIILAELAKAANDPAVESPRIYFAALIAGPSFFSDPRARASSHGRVAGEAPWLRAITTETDFAKVIAEAKATGATGIKIYANLTADLVAKITAEAHRQKMKAWSHAAIFPAKPGDAVSAGVDVISHSAYLVWESASQMPDSYRARLSGDYESAPVNSEALTALFKRMKEKGTLLDATLFIFNTLAQSPQPPPDVRNPASLANWSFEVARRAHELGVTILAGTDSMGGPGRDAFPNLHAELELLVGKCGLTPLEAITSATRTAAEAVGAQDSLGTITTGKVADIVVLSDDPTRDIRNTKKIVYVIKGGKLRKRDQTGS